MRISVDNQVCEAHGQCYAVAPDLFPLDDEGYSALGQGVDVLKGKEHEAQLGVASCPLLALSIDEE